MRPIVPDKRVKFRDPCPNRSRECPPETVIFDSFCDNVRLEADNDAISGVAVDFLGMDIHVKLGDSRSKGSRDIRWVHFVSNGRTNEHDRGL